MPPAPRYSRVIQNITITLIICLGVIGVTSVLWMREDIIARQQAYRYCLDMGYSPRVCYLTVFRSPKPWESQEQP